MKNSFYDMVTVPASTFRMGSTMEEIQMCFDYWKTRLLQKEYTPDKFLLWLLKEYPAHPVTIPEFTISKYPVTNLQYNLYCKETNSQIPESLRSNFENNHPVWGVSFDDAQGYAKWLSDKEGVTFRLPSESEWEFAAKGVENKEYPYGNEFCSSKANTYETGLKSVTPVNQFESYASEFGVCDMAGNVEEWVLDPYSPYPGGIWIPDDLTSTLGQQYPILRGGSFARGGDLSRNARRHGKYPSDTFRFTGFRLVSCISQRKEELWKLTQKNN